MGCCPYHVNDVYSYGVVVVVVAVVVVVVVVVVSVYLNMLVTIL